MIKKISIWIISSLLLTVLVVQNLDVQAVYVAPETLTIQNYTYQNTNMQVTVDWNRDGYDDIFSLTSTHLYVDINQKNGTFTRQQLLSSGGNSLFIFDENNDGYLDIIIHKAGTNGMSVYYGDGTLSFQQPTLLLSTELISNPKFVDVNQDGLLDLTYANNAEIGVYVNSSEGYLPKVVLATTFFIVIDYVFYDNDLDGDLDLFFSSTQRAYLSVQSGDMIFDERVQFGPTYNSGTGIYIVDIDSDGDLDLVALSSLANSEILFSINDGTNTMSAFTKIQQEKSYIYRGNKSFLMFKDFNYDGLLDIAYLISNNSGSYNIHYQREDGFVNTPDVVYNIKNGYEVSLADVDSNGLEDIVIYLDSTINGVKVIYQYGNVYQTRFETNGGEFIPSTQKFGAEFQQSVPLYTTTAIGKAYRLEQADVNFDGYDDVIALGYYIVGGSYATRLYVYLYNPDTKTLEAPIEVQTESYGGSSNYYTLHVTSHEDTETTDIVWSVSGNPTTVRFVTLDKNVQTLTESSVVTNNISLTDIVLIDVDGDNDIDMLHTDRNGAKIRLSLNNGDGTYTDSELATLNFAISLDARFIGDTLYVAALSTVNQVFKIYTFDQGTLTEVKSESLVYPSLVFFDTFTEDDLYPTIFVQENGNKRLLSYTFNGTTFGSPTKVIDTYGTFDASFQLIDLNRDGLKDLVVFGTNGSELSRWYPQQANQTFSNSFQFMEYNNFTSQMPTLGFFSDIDSDGDLDFIYINFQTINYYVLRNIEDLTAPNIPTDVKREGYLFEGWYIDQTLTTAYDAETHDFSKPQLILFAKWSLDVIKVTFIDDQGTLFEEVFEEGDDLTSVVIPTAREKVGYTFTSWSRTLPDTMSNQSITITANYQVNDYTITFETNGGTEVTPITQAYESNINAPAEPTKVGHTFNGWYSDEALTEAFSFDTMPLDGATLYAKWHVLSFDIQVIVSDTETLTFTFEYGSDISNFTLDDKEDLYFRGFFQNQALTTPYLANLMPANDLVLYAKYSALLEYDLSGVTWLEEGPFTYDGTEFEVLLDEETLPEGISLLRYENNQNSQAGTYEVTAYFTYNEETHVEPILKMTYVINKATFDMNGVTFSHPESVTYTGSPFEVTMLNLPDGLEVTYDDNVFTNAGTYTFDWSFTFDTNNYEAPVFQDTYTVEVEKATYDLSEIVWTDDADFIYNGTSQTVKIISGLPQGVSTYIYENASFTNAGTYEASVQVFYDTQNYEDPGFLTYSWTISKATYDLSNVLWTDDSNFVYDGNSKTVRIISGLPQGVSTYIYENASFTDSGTYEASVQVFYDTQNYEDPGLLTYTWSISKATYDLSNSVWTDDTSFVYNGQPFEVEIISSLPDGVTVLTYEDNIKTQAGIYTAKVIFETSDPNYDIPQAIEYTWEISKATYDMSQVSWVYDGPFTENGLVQIVLLRNLPTGITASYTNSQNVLPGIYTASVTFDYDDTNYVTPTFASITWEILALFDLNFDIDGQLTTITGIAGSPITVPNVPVKEGFTFKGWSLNIPTVMPEGGLDVSATYARNIVPNNETYQVVDFDGAFDLSEFSDTIIDLVLEIELKEDGLTPTQRQNALAKAFDTYGDKGAYHVVDVSVYALKPNQEKITLTEADDYFTITMNLPRSLNRYNGFEVYELVNSQLVKVTYVYVEALDELSFDVLNLGNYVIVYDTTYETPWGFIIPAGLALIFGLSYGIFYGIKHKKFRYFIAKDDDEDENDDQNIESIPLTVRTVSTKKRKKVIHYKYKK